VRVLLDQPDTAAKIAELLAAGRVPVLIAGEMTIWDSLAICEYLAEQFPEKHLWPQDVAARAMARHQVPRCMPASASCATPCR
jgi:glutathione S-transferase